MKACFARRLIQPQREDWTDISSQVLFRNTPCSAIPAPTLQTHSCCAHGFQKSIVKHKTQLCTHRKCETFRPRRPSSLAMHTVSEFMFYLYQVTAELELF